MIITRTPLRISFVGGGSDLAAYYREEPGEVVSTAIDQYVYISVNRKFDGRIRASYSRTELVDDIDDLQHELIREALRHTGVERGVEITSVSDIPSRGTGLGSSSAYTVGLLHSLYTHTGHRVTPERLARDACHIEIERCHQPIGKQDQYIAAYGGLQHITFHPDASVSVQAVRATNAILERFESHLLLLYTGKTRRTDEILPEQMHRTTHDPTTRARLRRMTAFAAPFRAALETGDMAALGELLHANWVEKRQITASITSRAIDHAYDTARDLGALGGKLLGAGGGGFLLLFAPPERHTALRHALSAMRHVPARLEQGGSRLVYIDPRVQIGATPS